MKQLLKICLGLCLFALISSCGSKDAHVLIETEYGNMKVLLYNETPIHKENFLKLVGEGFYDDLLFHRVMRGFMIQGGDPNSRGAAPGAPLGGGGPGYELTAEIGSPHFKGSLAVLIQKKNLLVRNSILFKEIK